MRPDPDPTRADDDPDALPAETDAIEPLVRIVSAPKQCLEGVEFVFYTVDRFRSDERRLILVHGPETEEALHVLGCTLCWDLLRDTLTGSGQFSAAIYYGQHAGKPGREAFHTQLARDNFRIHPDVDRTPSPVLAVSRRTFDIEFAFDAFLTAVLRADVVYLALHGPQWVPFVRVTTRSLISAALHHVVDKPIFYLEELEEIHPDWTISGGKA